MNVFNMESRGLIYCKSEIIVFLKKMLKTILCGKGLVQEIKFSGKKYKFDLYFNPPLISRNHFCCLEEGDGGGGGGLVL